MLFNASKTAQAFVNPACVSKNVMRHPLQQLLVDPGLARASFDKHTGTFNVPARTTAVFVQP